MKALSLSAMRAVTDRRNAYVFREWESWREFQITYSSSSSVTHVLCFFNWKLHRLRFVLESSQLQVTIKKFKKKLILLQLRICFSYQSLANSTVEGSRASSSSNKLLSDWEFELGEAALDVQYIGTYVVTLGERHLYCLKDTDGTIVWTRKLDYHPMCCTLLIPRLYSI